MMMSNNIWILFERQNPVSPRGLETKGANECKCNLQRDLNMKSNITIALLLHQLSTYTEERNKELCGKRYLKLLQPNLR